MDWYIFSETDRQDRAPDFRLESSRGGWVSLDDYRQTTNLVLFFPRDVECGEGSACQEALQGFIAHEVEYSAESTVVLAIFPSPVAALAGVSAEIGGQIPLLADPAGKTRRAYADLLNPEQEGRDLLFVLDRFGAPIVALAEGEAADPAIHTEVVDWLTYAEIKCPE